MNKSETINRKDVEYHCTMGAKGIENFSRFFTRNKLVGYTGATEILDHYDAWMTTAKGKYIVEIKTRDVPHDVYDTLFIECDKYAEGLCYHIQDGLIPLYISFFNDGWCLAINLLDCMFPNKTMKKNARNKGYEGEVTESNVVYELPITKGRFFKYV